MRIRVTAGNVNVEHVDTSFDTEQYDEFQYLTKMIATWLQVEDHEVGHYLKLKVTSAQDR